MCKSRLIQAGGDLALETEALIEMVVDFTGGGQGRGMMALEMVGTRGCKVGLSPVLCPSKKNLH